MVHISQTWTWGNPSTGQPSHSMRLQFDIDAATDLSVIEVDVTNIHMDGWNEATPDTGTTEDCIVIATNLDNLPSPVSQPSRPFTVPYPADLLSRGGFAEMMTYLNSGNPQRYFWRNDTSFSYTIPYEGPNTKVVAGWASSINGAVQVVWTATEWSVKLSDLDYRPGMCMTNGSWESHNRDGGWAHVREGGWTEMRTFPGYNNPPYFRASGEWRDQAKVGNNA